MVVVMCSLSEALGAYVGESTLTLGETWLSLWVTVELGVLAALTQCAV
jgi:hypothetical protein